MRKKSNNLVRVLLKPSDSNQTLKACFFMQRRMPERSEECLSVAKLAFDSFHGLGDDQRKLIPPEALPFCLNGTSFLASKLSSSIKWPIPFPIRFGFLKNIKP